MDRLASFRDVRLNKQGFKVFQLCGEDSWYSCLSITNAATRVQGAAAEQNSGKNTIAQPATMREKLRWKWVSFNADITKLL